MSNLVFKENQINNYVLPYLNDSINYLNSAYNKFNQLDIPSDFIQKEYLNNVKNRINDLKNNVSKFKQNVVNSAIKIKNIENKNQNFNNTNNTYKTKIIKTTTKSNNYTKPSLVLNTFVNRAFAEQNKMTSTKTNQNRFSFKNIIDDIKNPNKLKENIKNGFNSLQKFYKDNKDTINTALIVIAALKSGGNKKENNYPDNAEKIAKDMTNSIISNMKDGKILINSALNGKGGLKDTYSTVWNGITNTANAALNGKGGLKDTYSGVLNSIANNELVKNTASGWNIILTNPGRSGENLKIAADWAWNGKNGLKDSIEHPDIWLSNIGMTAAGFTFGLAKGIESVADGLLKSGGMVVKGGLSIYDLVRGDLNLSTVKNYDEILNQVISYDSTKVYEDMYFSNDNVKIMEKESVIKKDSEGYLLSKIVGGVASNIILLSGTSVVASSSVSSAAALVSGISSFGGNFENEINKNTIDLKYGTNDLSLNIDYNTLQIIKDLKVGHSTTITQTLPTSNGGSIELKLNIKSLGNGKYDITDQYGNKVEFKDFNEANVTKAEIVSLIKGGRDAALYYAGAKVNEAQFEPLVGGIKNSLLKTTAQSGIRVTLDALSGAVTVPSDTAITMIADNKSLEEAWEENGGTTAMINNIITGAGFSALSEAGNITSSFKGTKVASRINKEGFTAKNLDDISKLKGYELKSYVEESIKNGTFESTFKFINKQELDNIGKMFNKTDLQKITDTKLDYKIHIEDNILTSNLKDKITKEQLDYMKNLKGDDLEAFMNKATQLGKLKDVLNYLDENEVKRFENIIIEDNIKRHGYQLNIDDMGDIYKTKLKSGFFTEEQIKNMLNNINEKGYINKETGDHLKNLFDNKYDIYVKTVNSSDIDSIFENGVYCNGTSTSGFGMKPTSIKDIYLENTVTGIDCLYDMTVKVKSANGVSQGGNPIDGTIILKVPKGISKEDMLIKLQDGNYSINPKYIDSFIGVDNRGIVNDVVYNKTINSATKSPIKSSPDSITKNTEPKITNTSKISQIVNKSIEDFKSYTYSNAYEKLGGLRNNIEAYNELIYWNKKNKIDMIEILNDENISPEIRQILKNEFENTSAGKAVAKLTTSEFEACNKFSGESYKGINNNLRGKTNDLSNDYLKNITDKVDSAILKQDGLNEDMLLYRNTTISSFENLIKNGDIKSLEGQVFTDEAYMSTSVSKGFYNKNFLDTTITIKTPKGTKALNMMGISGNAEGEFLLGRNNSLYFEKVEESIVNGKKHYEIIATLLPDEVELKTDINPNNIKLSKKKIKVEQEKNKLPSIKEQLNKIKLSKKKIKVEPEYYEQHLYNIVTKLEEIEPGSSITKIRNAIETKDYSAIPNDKHIRDFFMSIPDDYKLKYCSALETVQNLKNGKMEIGIDIKIDDILSVDGAYGMDQYSIERLIRYNYNGEEVSYRRAIEMIENAKKNGLEIPRFQKIKSKEYLKLEEQLINLGFTDKEASLVLASVNKLGACTYVTPINDYIQHFGGLSNLLSKMKYNSKEELLLELFLYANNTKNGGYLFEIINNKVKMKSMSAELGPLGEINFDLEKDFICLSNNNRKLDKVIESFFKSKGLDIEYKTVNRIVVDEGESLDLISKANIIQQVYNNLSEGNMVEIDIVATESNSFIYHDYYSLGYRNNNVISDVGHSTKITGMCDDGFVVCDGTGEKRIILYEELFDNTEFYLYFTKMSGGTK